MSSAKEKKFPLVSAFLTVAAIGGLAALALRIYLRPWETMIDTIRAGMLLVGIREETANLGGVLMHYYCSGRRGTPVILIHGLGNSAEVWAALMPLLSKEYLVYAPDMPGFGKTPLAPQGTNVATHVLYLERFLDALGYPQVTLVGNSLGGWIATRFAIANSERVNRLYLLNSAGLRREQMNSPYAVDRIAAQLSANHMLGYPRPLPGFILDAIVRVSQMPAYANFVKGYDIQEELDSVLSQVQTPTTIIWGEQDKIFPITCAYDLHTGIANSELVLLPDVGHLPQLQASAKVAEIISKDHSLWL